MCKTRKRKNLRAFGGDSINTCTPWERLFVGTCYFSCYFSYNDLKNRRNLLAILQLVPTSSRRSFLGTGRFTLAMNHISTAHGFILQL